MLHNLIFVLILIFALTTTIFSQNKVKELTINGGCSYYGESLDSKIYTFESDEAAVEAIDRILDPTGLVRNFDIRAADVSNAAAIVIGETRYILYNQAFMRRVKNETKTDWAAISIMAHELGHHLNGHTLVAGGSRPPLELEADSFSGFVLYKMGATLEEAQAAMSAISSEKGSATHPAKRSRLAAIESGWTKAKDQDKSVSKVPTDLRTPPDSSNSSKLIGTWKGEVARLGADPITRTYHKNGSFNITVWNSYSTTKIEGNWKYIPSSDSLGILEEYQGDSLMERGTVRWLNSNQYEYTVTHHINVRYIGGRLTYTRQ